MIEGARRGSLLLVEQIWVDWTKQKLLLSSVFYTNTRRGSQLDTSGYESTVLKRDGRSCLLSGVIELVSLRRRGKRRYLFSSVIRINPWKYQELPDYETALYTKH